MNQQSVFLSGKVLSCVALAGMVVAVLVFSWQADRGDKVSQEVPLRPEMKTNQQPVIAQEASSTFPGIEAKSH